MGLPPALPEGRDPDSGSHSPARVHHAYNFAGGGRLQGVRVPAGWGGRMGSYLPAQARTGQTGARHGRGRPLAQAPDICVSAAATVPADGSGHTLPLAVGWS